MKTSLYENVFIIFHITRRKTQYSNHNNNRINKANYVRSWMKIDWIIESEYSIDNDRWNVDWCPDHDIRGVEEMEEWRLEWTGWLRFSLILGYLETSRLVHHIIAKVSPINFYHSFANYM